MTVAVRLNQCVECSAPTENHNLICDGCADLYPPGESDDDIEP